MGVIKSRLELSWENEVKYIAREIDWVWLMLEFEMSTPLLDG